MLPSKYEQRARLRPGLLLLLPIGLTLAILGVDQRSLISTTSALLMVTGGPLVLMPLVSSAGRRLEPRLHKKWGGTPSNQLLRICSHEESLQQREVWRSSIEKVTGLQLATEDVEARNLTEADLVIKSAFGQVRYIGQDESRYPVVSAENAQYGFERNLFAIRHLGRAISTACLIIFGSLWLAGVIPVATAILGALGNLLLLMAWVIVPSERRTREAGFRYATQLLNTVARMAREGK